MKKTVILISLLAVLCSGCAQSQVIATATTAEEPAVTVEPAATVATEDLFSNRDLSAEIDLSAAETITLSESLTITNEGTYLLSGSLSDGQVIIDAGESDKVQLVLDGVDITSQTSAAIYCKQADKVFISLADGSTNTLRNGGSYIPVDDNNVDAVIFSKCDLTLNGSGSLEVITALGHGIVSKDELVITGGSYTINAAEHGLTGKDCISIAGGTFHIQAGEDGIHAKKESNAEKGFLYFGGGNFIIDANKDAISATGPIQIDDGSFVLHTEDDGIHSDATVLIAGGTIQIPVCYEGIEGRSVWISGGTIDIVSTDDGINAAGGMDGSGKDDTFLPGSVSITVTGGSITIVSDGDSLDANGTIALLGGKLNLTCNGNGNTALDCDDALTIDGADVTTNDGSENSGGFTGKGGKGNHGKMGEPPRDGSRPDGFGKKGKHNRDGDGTETIPSTVPETTVSTI